jgi:hypothetical protein
MKVKVYRALKVAKTRRAKRLETKKAHKGD